MTKVTVPRSERDEIMKMLGPLPSEKSEEKGDFYPRTVEALLYNLKYSIEHTENEEDYSVLHALLLGVKSAVEAAAKAKSGGLLFKLIALMEFITHTAGDVVLAQAMKDLRTEKREDIDAFYTLYALEYLQEKVRKAHDNST